MMRLEPAVERAQRPRDIPVVKTNKTIRYEHKDIIDATSMWCVLRL